jgi:hypothetical protein
MGVKQLGHDVDHPPPCSAMVKNGRGIPPQHHAFSWDGSELITVTTVLLLINS